MEPVHVSGDELVWLGRMLVTLLNPKMNSLDIYADTLAKFVYYAERCGFHQTANQAEPMKGRLMDADFHQYVRLNDHFASVATGVERALHSEATATNAILTSVQAPPELLGLQNLQPHQQALRNDLVTCLQTHLHRPAIVMAWALGFDLIRTWVFNDTIGRLQAFNNQLQKTHRTGEPAKVDDFHDFFRLGEYRFLEICRDSQDDSLKGFADKTLRALQGMLDQRNEFAHANHSQANEPEAHAYVLRMLRILKGPPFV